ncbi:MAG: TIR domain-containing protein [Pyrinomonadaceae bacterium]|nr:TIR domain-containing protein [Pyrinomonadaceae bacterium]
MKDFFISYNQADEAWARWVAWELDNAGYEVIIQAWHFMPGSNFVLEMHKAIINSRCTIAILSNNYLQSQYTQPEWAAALVHDPTGKKRKLLPVRVKECEPKGLLAAIVNIDLVGKTEREAGRLLLDQVKRVYGRPINPPAANRQLHEREPYPRTDAEEHIVIIKEPFWQRIYERFKLIIDRFSFKVDYTENRKHLLNAVREMWIKGVLEDMKAPFGASLRIRFRVSKEANNDTTAEATFARPARAEEDVYAAFNKADHSLLILGDPGAGKTFLLLELLNELLKRAEQDRNMRIPVVLNLSSWVDWASRKESMRDWLISELVSVYDLSRKLAQHFVDNEWLILLLDGLDEITAGGPEPASVDENGAQKLSVTCRRKCLEELNKYIEWRDTWLALCCREDEYKALGIKLHTRRDNAILRVLPLTDKQVETYLKKAGQKLKSLRKAIAEDPTLREMARTPFLLKIMSIAYEEQDGLSAQVIVEGGKGDEEAHRKHLFEKYVSACNRSGKRSLSEHYRLWRDYLGELAEKMERGGSKLFLVDQLQPAPPWLTASSDRWLYRALVCLFLFLFVWILVGLPAGWAIGYEEAAVKWAAAHAGADNPAPIPETLWHFSSRCMFLTALGCGAIVAIGFAFLKTWDFGIACGLAFGVSRMIAIGMGYDKKSFNAQESLSSTLTNQDSWLTQGLISAGLGAIVLLLVMKRRDHNRDRIHPFERRKWNVRIALFGVAAAAIVGVIFGKLFDPTHGWSFGIVMVLILARAFGYRKISHEIKSYPNQGILRSAYNALLMGLLHALIGMICFGIIYWVTYKPNQIISRQDQGIVNGILGLTVGVTSLIYGGMPLMQHLSLRLVLKLRGLAPLRLVDFLKKASAIKLMRKVGGGYMFPHDYLREFFLGIHQSKAKRP